MFETNLGAGGGDGLQRTKLGVKGDWAGTPYGVLSLRDQEDLR